MAREPVLRARPPIFILSATPRSGTNFLWELLRRHPDCIPARSPLWEDYILKTSPHLFRFAQAAQRSWDPVWGSTEALRAELLRSLGDGVVSFLSTDPQRRVVTKSPTIANLDLFFRLFPDGHLLLLIRDGRDVAASGMKTFGWTLQEAAAYWAWGAADIARFVAEHPNDAVKVVQFEDVVADTERALLDVLSFLDLDAGSYDLAELDRIPVRGSSTYFGPGRTDVNWDVVARPAGFSPIGRWRSWSDGDIAMFERFAGRELQRWGYEIVADDREFG